MDLPRIQARFSRNAHSYDSVSEVQRLLAERLLEMALPHLPSGSYVDIGAGTGHLTRLLASQNPVTSLTALDVSQAMLDKLQSTMSYSPGAAKVHTLAGDAEKWLPTNPVDALFSSAALQWFRDVKKFCARLPELVKPGGLVALGTFGPASLRELHSAFQQSQNRRLNPGVRYLTTFELLESLHLGSCTPLVWESALYAQSWSTPRELLRSLRDMGVTGGDAQALPGPTALRSLEEALRHEAGPDGRIPCTWEMVWVIGKMTL